MNLRKSEIKIIFKILTNDGWGDVKLDGGGCGPK